jgi:hypothetical protein
MIISIREKRFSIILVGFIFAGTLLVAFLDGSARDIATIVFVVTALVYAVIWTFLSSNRDFIRVTNEKIICRDKKRNISFESSRSEVKLKFCYWRKEKFDKTYDIPVVKIDANNGESISFAISGFPAYEWIEKVEHVGDYDIELEWEKWESLIQTLGIWDKLKKKPLVVPEKIREPVVKIMYLGLFGLIGLAAYYLYWAIFIGKIFEA